MENYLKALPKFITVNPDFLFHTTMRNFGKIGIEYWENSIEDRGEDILIPPIGEYHKGLHKDKFFTVDSKSNYASEHQKDAYVFLKYKSKKKPMKLYNYESHETSLNPDDDERFYEKYSKFDCDGYIGYEDNIEICLRDPSKFLHSEPEEIPFDFSEENLREREFQNLNIEKKMIFSVVMKDDSVISTDNIDEALKGKKFTCKKLILVSK